MKTEFYCEECGKSACKYGDKTGKPKRNKPVNRQTCLVPKTDGKRLDSVTGAW